MIEILDRDWDQSKKINVIYDGFKKNEELLDEIKLCQKSVSSKLNDINKYIADPEKTDSLSLTSDLNRVDMFLGRLFGQIELVSEMLKNTERHTTRLRDLARELGYIDVSWYGKDSLKRFLEDDV